MRRADWNYVAGLNELEEHCSAVLYIPTIDDLEGEIVRGGSRVEFEDYVEDGGYMDALENLFGLLHNQLEQQKLPFLQGLTWSRWMELLEETSRPPPPPPRIRAPKPMDPRRRLPPWPRTLTTLGTIPSARSCAPSSRSAKKRATSAATTSS